MPSDTIIQKIVSFETVRPKSSLHFWAEELRERVTKEVRNPIGTMVAVKRPDGIHIGVSLLSKKDRYNHALGLKIAKGRAAKEGSICLGRRQTGTVVPQLEAFVARAKRYFATEEVAYGYYYPDRAWVATIIS